MCPSKFGSRNSPSAAARSSSVSWISSFPGSRVFLSCSRCRSSSFNSTRPRSRPTTSSFTPSSSPACFAYSIRCREEYRSNVSTCKLSPRVTSTFTRNIPKLVFFSSPSTRYRRSPCVIVISSPLTSTGTSLVGDTASESGGADSAAKGRSLCSSVLASMGSVIFSLAASSSFPSLIATVGRCPFPNHSALFSTIPRLFAAGCTFSAYSFASIPFGNCTRKHSMPIARSSSASDCAARSPASSRS